MGEDVQFTPVTSMNEFRDFFWADERFATKKGACLKKIIGISLFMLQNDIDGSRFHMQDAPLSLSDERVGNLLRFLPFRRFITHEN